MFFPAWKNASSRLKNVPCGKKVIYIKIKIKIFEALEANKKWQKLIGIFVVDLLKICQKPLRYRAHHMIHNQYFDWAFEVFTPMA